MSSMPKEEKFKSRRGTGASCRECRRLKVRCDREVPCGSCVRRGCFGICPDGQLSAVKSARYVLASTEELHQRIQALTFRVNELEFALEQSHGKVDSGTHPLLESQLRKLAKDPRQSDSEDEGEAKDQPFQGTSSDSFMDTFNPEHPQATAGFLLEHNNIGGPWLSTIQTALQNAVSSLPPREDAWKLIEAYYEYAAIMYQLVPRSQAFSSILIPIYRPDASSPTAFDLSCLYSLLALGAFHDLTKPAFTSEASRWLSISQDLLLSSIDSWSYNLPSIEAMILLALAYLSTPTVDTMKTYHLISSAMKCAQMLNLHKDPEPGTVTSEELIRRRRVFWELWTLDCASALEFDQPPGMLKVFVECELPLEVVERRSHEAIYLQWKYNLTIVSQEILTLLLPSSSNVPYASIMVLDHKIRGTKPAGLPEEVESARELGVDVKSLDIIRSTLINGMSQAALLYLHKPYFAFALQREDQNPMAGKFAPSVLACYSSSTEILNGAFLCLQEQPLLLGRLGTVWSGYIKSTIVLYAIALFMPYWINASDAVKKADTAVGGLFEPYVDCLRAQQALPVLKNLQVLAHAAIQRQSQGAWVHPNQVSSQATPSVSSQSNGSSKPYAPSSDVIMELFGASSGGVHNADLFNRVISTISPTSYAEPTSRAPTPQIYQFTVPSSSEETVASTNHSWDDLIRGIQTSRMEPSASMGLGPTDASAPSSKALRQAWPRLMQKLNVNI